MVMYCVWLSVDPVGRKIDYYPRSIALKIEKYYKERDIYNTSTCPLDKDFFNATIHFHPLGLNYQTTPGIYLGRAGFKQPGYRSVNRVILNGNDRRIKIFSKQVYGEWRITNSEFDSDICFDELVSEESKIQINDEDIQIEKIETWKPEDLDSNSLDTNIIVWQWCRGTIKSQGNLYRLSNEWFVPYNFEITQQIENAFNTNDTVTIELPLLGERQIQFISGTCYAKQVSLDGTRVRFMRRIITTIQELKIMFNSISKTPININKIMENLPDGTVPHHFNCPILQDIMKDPVKTIDGHIYDRESILRWFTVNTTSPLTGLRLESLKLEPCIELKKQIDDFLSSLINPESKNTTNSQVLTKDNNLLYNNSHDDSHDDSDHHSDNDSEYNSHDDS